ILGRMLKTVASYYETAISPAVQQTWDKLPKEKLITAAKIIGAAVILFKLYQAYQSYQALKQQVERQGTELNGRINTLNTDLKAANDEIGKLKVQLSKSQRKIAKIKKEMDETIGPLLFGVTSNPSVTGNGLDASAIVSTSPKSSSLDDDDDDIAPPQPAVTNHAPKTTSVESLRGSEGPSTNASNNLINNNNTEVDAVTKNPNEEMLELFKNQFPGKHLNCTYTHQDQTIETNFYEFLLKNFFRMNESPTCVFIEEQNSFTLTFENPKEVIVHDLPMAIWNKIWGISSILYYAMIPVLKLKPTVKISQTITVQFIQENAGTKMIFNDTGIALTPTLGYSGHLKSITIPNNPEEKLLIEGFHNFPYNKTGGPVLHQTFVETTSLFFSSDQEI
ncbi:MAG: hypothetical protein ABSA17_07875, partial [Rhabdochlamydiaceae bacterium]